MERGCRREREGERHGLNPYANLNYLHNYLLIMHVRNHNKGTIHICIINYYVLIK